MHLVAVSTYLGYRSNNFRVNPKDNTLNSCIGNGMHEERWNIQHMFKYGSDLRHFFRLLSLGCSSK